MRWAVRFFLSSDGDVAEHGRIVVLGDTDFRILVAGALQLLEEHAPETHAQAQAGVTQIVQWTETELILGTGKRTGTAVLLVGPDDQGDSPGVAVDVASAALAARAELTAPQEGAAGECADHAQALARLAARLAEVAARPGGPRN